MSRAPKIPDDWGGPDDGQPKALRLVPAPEVKGREAGLFSFRRSLLIAGVVLSCCALVGTMIWIQMAVAPVEERSVVVVMDGPEILEEEEEEREVVRHEPEALPPTPPVVVAPLEEEDGVAGVPMPDVEVSSEPFEVVVVWEEEADLFPKPKPQVAKVTPKPTVTKRATKPRSTPKPRTVKRGPTLARSYPVTYPAAARRSGVEGSVLISVAVQTNGKPSAVSLVSSSGSGLLDAAALRAVRKYVFHPATVNGKPTAGEVRVPVRFKLQ